MSASPAFRRLAVLLIFAIAAHNFEEWLTFPQYGELMVVMGQNLGLQITPQPWSVVEKALVVVTVVPALLLAAGMGIQNKWGVWVVCWIASIFLANVFIPHIPAMFVVEGYAPGILTAILVIFPLTLLILRRVRKERLLSKGQIAMTVATGVLTLPIAIQLAFFSARIFES